MAQCQVCGKANLDDARFCFNCGTPISQGPPVKVEVKSPLTSFPTAQPMSAPPPIYPPRQVPRQGSCYYHPELPSMYICSRCGRPICMGCSRQYGVLTFCSECYHGLLSKIGSGPSQFQYPQYQYQQFPYQYGYEQQPEQRRSLFGF
jgi:predicted amidophosphoribosyltransferase